VIFKASSWNGFCTSGLLRFGGLGQVRAGGDLARRAASPFQVPHARKRIRASVIGFRDVEPPHFVLQRCALQPETLRSRSRTRNLSRSRF
jgi:hypothetical protein